jgi:hypothetical protein
MMGAQLFRVSLPALAVATALAAGPALAAGAVPPRPGGPVARCFDPVSVVLGAKPHRGPEAMARRGGGQAAQGQAAATPTDARPILTLVMERPRDCKGPLDWVSVSAPSQLSGMLDGEPGGDFGAPLHATLAATAQGAGDMAPARAAASADLTASADPVAADDPPAGGLTVSGGFVLPSSPVHGLAGRAAMGASIAPNFGIAGFSAPQGAASSVAKSPDALSTPGDPPVARVATAGIAGIPEPATWAMLVMGLFGLGAAVRQRRTPSALGRAI